MLQMSLEEAEKRILELKGEIGKMVEETESSSRALIEATQAVLDQAAAARSRRQKLENLKAEALYLRLLHNLSGEEPATPDTGLDSLDRSFKEIRAVLQPTRPDAEWLERIREAEAKHAAGPALTPEERAELEQRLRDNVCPICVSFALDGSCRLEAFESCPIDLFLNRLVTITEELGHRPWMEDYFERMYRDICPCCSGRVEGDYCPPRDEGECSLYSYLPTVVRTIEAFLKERGRK